ncbi:hypothetical protein Fmac_015262 [Flemingia macrophylla]|uniref:Uncharacterized protein n=1 Tax=Flemingia macrophylla TaxID=520843 RepID=A0ABD1ME32_9FABA
MMSLSLEEFMMRLRDTSVEARKLEGKLDAYVNLVTQLAANKKLASCKSLTASVLPMTTTQVSILLRSNLEWMSIPRLIARNDVIVIRGVHDVATDTSAEARKQEGNLDALVNLVPKLAANQLSASVARVCGIRSYNDHHTSVCPSSQQSGVDEHPEAYFSARNDAIVIRGVHDVATYASSEARKPEGKLDALVNLVTQLAANKNPASVAKVCGIRSSNDHHISVCPSSQQSGFSARNDAIVIRIVHDLATDTSVEARKLEGKLDALANLVTQLAANQKLASVAKVCGIRSSNDHHTSIHLQKSELEGKLNTLVNLVTQLSTNQKPASVPRVCGIRSSNDHQTSFSARNDAIVIRGVHDVATDTSAEEARKPEGKLDALVNLVTQLAANQNPASIARVCGIRSSTDHHISVCPSSQQSGVDEYLEAYAANTYSRPPQQQTQAT